ncbi:unnamed protein product [Pleuronectes platessa]|uniref:Sulfotransferase n=1 Tax=Pleuronectes platessa TaxID=8262 RepID=A0A9N7TZD4_PLEPL|nr:unnamed protein product [Pleuronectes platessa]
MKKSSRWEARDWTRGSQSQKFRRKLEVIDITKFVFTALPGRSEDMEKAQYFRLHQRRTEENKEAEPAVSNTQDWMEMETDEKDSGASTKFDPEIRTEIVSLTYTRKTQAAACTSGGGSQQQQQQQQHQHHVSAASPPPPADGQNTEERRVRERCGSLIHRLAIMQCSWKSMVLLALASIAIQYTAIRTFSTKPLSLLCSGALTSTGQAVNCSLKDLTVEGSDPVCDGILSNIPSSPNSSLPTYDVNKRTHILILATTRSGSSFVGQLFNQHPEVFYLFEPLFHVQSALLPRLVQSRNLAERRVMMGAATDLLRSLYHCHLISLENYIRPRPSNHSTDKLFRRGASRSLCSPPVCEVPLGPDEQSLVLTDEGECGKRCGPLNVSLAADACRGKRHIAIKTVRIPQISDLRALIEDPRLNLKVVQLVRDPRGILASRVETFRDTYRLWRLWRATGRRPHNLDLGQIKTVCEDFLRSLSMGLAKPAWLRGRYMLLRALRSAAEQLP